MRWPNPLRELSRTDFVSELDALVAVYAAAMRPDPGQLPGRRSIMQLHASYRGFRALAVVADEAGRPEGAPRADGAGLADGARRAALARRTRRARRGDTAGRIIGFGYSFSGAPGQWWHDVVAAALAAGSGPAFASGWLADSLEIAELHVHPDFHRRGIGRSLLLGLAEGRRERTAVLSTQDADSPARRLYRALGFTDLLTAYNFPGSAHAYAVMGATLPLRPAPGTGTPGTGTPGTGTTGTGAPGPTHQGTGTPGLPIPGPGWPAGPGGPAPRVPAAGRSPGWPGSR